MPSADDPSRLLDDPAESADLRRGLERMSRDLPDAEVMGRLAARLGIAERGHVEQTQQSPRW